MVIYIKKTPHSWGTRNPPKTRKEKNITIHFTVSGDIPTTKGTHITEESIEPPTLMQLYKTLKKYGYDVSTIELTSRWISRLPLFENAGRNAYLAQWFRPFCKAEVLITRKYEERVGFSCRVCNERDFSVRFQKRTRLENAIEAKRVKNQNLCNSCFLTGVEKVYIMLQSNPDIIDNKRDMFSNYARLAMEKK